MYVQEIILIFLCQEAINHRFVTRKIAMQSKYCEWIDKKKQRCTQAFTYIKRYK